MHLKNDKSFSEQLCSEFLKEIGEDVSREGLVKTPERYAKAFAELTSGYKQSTTEIVNGAIFEEDYSEMVIVRDIEFYSLCEHHLLPFFGKAQVAYIPDGKIIGLSKIPRIVKMFAKRLQVQERLTGEIADELVNLLKPLGVACLIEANHLCMMMRGVQSQSGFMVTSAMRGCFMDEAVVREEFLSLVGKRSG